MAEEYAANLSTYKAQLQQVEAALTTDAENEELLKLQSDLKEVIELTLDLLKASQGGAGKSHIGITLDTTQDDDEDLLPPGIGADGLPTQLPISMNTWSVGDKCQGIWSKDKSYYNASIAELDNMTGMCTITFDGYDQSEIVMIATLRSWKENDANKRKSKKEQSIAEREYRKKKSLKKAARLKELEQAREVEKVKWQQFSSKSKMKSRRGLVTKSIFASPDTVEGRVGIGTCGTGGKPMTEFSHQPKLLPQKR